MVRRAAWGNLESHPDTARVSSLSDFYRARFLYRLSQGGEAVEASLALETSTLPAYQLGRQELAFRNRKKADQASTKDDSLSAQDDRQRSSFLNR
jgi:hypothetical protein